MLRRRSSKEWFRIWDRIISLEDKLSRVKLSELSGASVQVIKSLQKDWMDQNAVTYDGQEFKLFKAEDISISLSTFTPNQTLLTEQEKVKGK